MEDSGCSVVIERNSHGFQDEPVGSVGAAVEVEGLQVPVEGLGVEVADAPMEGTMGKVFGREVVCEEAVVSLGALMQMEPSFISGNWLHSHSSGHWLPKRFISSAQSSCACRQSS